MPFNDNGINASISLNDERQYIEAVYKIIQMFKVLW